MEDMIEQNRELEQTETDTSAQSNPSENSPGEPEEANKEAGMNMDTALKDLVRTEIERRVAEIYPVRQESPRIEPSQSQLSAADYLRLGYGARTPHT
ncbi:MAG: hypothetical protein A2Y63_04210 [Candidatus Riflebacteria bacterium RBG_13_59_9]|nr:MAG: hypothetical protein A2Y63_04210 [Candidatus Riflebacteria bacterium RBG_13_59_9]